MNTITTQQIQLKLQLNKLILIKNKCYLKYINVVYYAHYSTFYCGVKCAELGKFTPNPRQKEKIIMTGEQLYVDFEFSTSSTLK
jgi:hypothetical protein